MSQNIPAAGSMTVGFRGGPSAQKQEQADFSRILSSSELEGSLDAALLLKSTGIVVASWTHEPAPREVMSVMAATMWGSLDTLIRSLGGEAPRGAYLEVQDRRMLVRLVEPNWILLLVGPRTAGKRRLRQEAQRIADRLSRIRARNLPSSNSVEIQG